MKVKGEFGKLKKSANEIRGVFNRALMLMAAAFALIAFEPGAARAALMRFKIDADRSTVSVTVAEPAAWIRGDATGTFKIIDGAVSFDRANISRTARATNPDRFEQLQQRERVARSIRNRKIARS